MSVRGGRIFALLIGIDEYAVSRYNLSGCVNDCNEVEAWLKETFDQPYIQRLTNQDATRTSILQHIKDLAVNRRISYRDPILIYYAGHGMEVLPLPEWNSTDTRALQMRMPYDFDATTDDSRDFKGILDREFSEHLAAVSKQKGDNIVVILDSCHSASGTRDDSSEFAIRGITLPADYAKRMSLSQGDFSSRSLHGLNASRAASTTPENHVLLAACREDQTAAESRRTRRGAFTEHLLKQLRCEGSLSLTYAELILGLGKVRENQTPHCDGTHKDRVLFTLNRKEVVFHPIEYTQSNARDLRRLPLGASHGINPKSHFLIFAGPDFCSAYYGEGVIEQAEDMQSFLRVPPETPYKAAAVRSIASQDRLIRITINEPDVLSALGDLTWFPRIGVQLVEGEDADLKLIHDKENRIFYFAFLNGAIPLASTRFHPWPVDKDRWIRILQQMGHYYYYLDRTIGPSSTPPLTGVEVNLMPVNPLTQSELGGAVETCSKGHIHLLAGDGKRYGIKVINNSKEDVYFALFYFSQSRFRIETFYNPPTVAGGMSTPCLQAGGSKTIGYGTPGDAPWYFDLSPSEESDVGYLKLFYSNKYLDLQHITRQNIFWPEQECDRHRRGLSKNMNRSKLTVTSERAIGTFKLPIFQLKDVVNGGEPCTYT